MAAKRKFAVFDIDGTLIRWQLLHATLHEMGKRGQLPPGAHEEIVAARNLWKTRAGGETSFSKYETALVGVLTRSLTKLDVQAFHEAETTVFEQYKDQVYQYTKYFLRDLKAKNYLLFAVSGAPDVVAQLLTAYYGFDAFAATHHVEQNGQFTGEIHVAAHKKPELLKRLVQEAGASFDGSIGVGDSEGDIAMLELVEHPTAFNPTKKLFQHAREAGWKIVVERKNMVYELEPKNGDYFLANSNA